jgi:phosphoribosyl-ATP pyrophosphohydrolase/phosphoribosyl-AMP cyclohydrolase
MLELAGSPSAAGADPAARRHHRLRAFPERFVADSQASKRQVGEVLEALEQVIAARKGGDASRSYTAKLLAGGPAVAGAKVTEEAQELVRAAGDETDDRVVSEAADLVYHTLVLLACRDVALERVEAELARRFGVSGLTEKAARTAKGDAS